MPSRAQPAAVFSNRELNGEVLLEELSDLRTANVHQKAFVDCVQGLRDLPGSRVSEAVAKVKQLASGRFAGQPAMAGLLVRWAGRIKSEVDVPLLVGHFERLARVAAAVSAMRRAAERLPKGGRG
jgi:hypothetical protein